MLLLGNIVEVDFGFRMGPLTDCEIVKEDTCNDVIGRGSPVAPV